MQYCICIHPGAYGCPLCRPHKWIKTETDTYIMWIEKRIGVDPYMYYI